MDFYDIFISIIIIVKLVYSISFFGELFLKTTHKDKSEFAKKMTNIKEKSDLLFLILMAVFLIIVFRPNASSNANGVLINKHEQLLLFVLGIVIIFTEFATPTMQSILSSIHLKI